MVVALVAAIGIGQMARMGRDFRYAVEDAGERMRAADRILRRIAEVAAMERDLILSGDTAEMDGLAARMDDALAGVDRELERLRAAGGDTGGADLDAFAERWSEYVGVNRRVRELARLNSNVRARELSDGPGRTAFERFQALAAERVAESRNRVAERAEAAREADRRVALGGRIVRNLLYIHRAEKDIILEIRYNVERPRAERRDSLAAAEMVAEAGRAREVVAELRRTVGSGKNPVAHPSHRIPAHRIPAHRIPERRVGPT
jgi:methyl-accepting chemotaxis protein